MSKNHTYYEAYLEAPLSDVERKELENLDKDSPAFAGYPAFGTGGMREIVAPGTATLNIYNIARVNMALAATLKKHIQENAKVVMAYDSRKSGPEFFRVSYHVLKQAGLQVKIFRRPTPTPMLSFAVRELECDAGIVITASHNPPEYNGYKVYWSDGAQIIPPYDKEIEKLFQEISFSQIPQDIHQLKTKDIDENDLIEEELVKKYISNIENEGFISPGPKKTKIIYSPLHGTGGWIFDRVFGHLGYENFSVLSLQAEPDGDFPTTKSPNPEEKAAFEKLVEEGKKTEAKLLLATDPDADRVGAAVYDGNDYVFLTGNQAGALLLESIARQKAAQLKNPFICKTIVTTELQTHIAAAHQVKTVETLTGFKYIAAEVSKDPENYLFGGEESYGYLPVHWVRDKDSLSSALALAELAEKENLLDSLDELYIKHGLYHELLHNIKLSGGNEHLMGEIMNKLKDPSGLAGDSIGPRKILDILDLQETAKPAKTEKVKEYQNELPSGKVIQYWFEPEGRLTIRPSGTEPKIKVYVSLRHKQKQTKETLPTAKKELKQEAEATLQAFLKLIGM